MDWFLFQSFNLTLTCFPVVLISFCPLLLLSYTLLYFTLLYSLSLLTNFFRSSVLSFLLLVSTIFLLHSRSLSTIHFQDEEDVEDYCPVGCDRTLYDRFVRTYIHPISILFFISCPCHPTIYLSHFLSPSLPFSLSLSPSLSLSLTHTHTHKHTLFLSLSLSLPLSVSPNFLSFSHTLSLNHQGSGGADIITDKNNLSKVVALTEGYSGSDLTAVSTSVRVLSLSFV